MFDGAGITSAAPTQLFIEEKDAQRILYLDRAMTSQVSPNVGAYKGKDEDQAEDDPPVISVVGADGEHFTVNSGGSPGN